MLILGIETSCDETAAAVVEDGLSVRSSVVSSQLVHALYGGVVPELAARAHIRMIVPVVEQALREAGIDYAQVELIAVTHAPGLLGALLVGLPFAKGLSFSLNIPFVGVNHIEGHIFALRLEYPQLQPPYLGVVLSGGHTELLFVDDWCKYQELGATVDDACGEAFDKVAKLLGLPYPGGIEIERLALEGRPVIDFPVADAGGLDFSFSGLKTAVLYYLREHPDAHRPDVAASFQVAAVRQITKRVEQAVRQTGMKKVGVSGGVAANRYLRQQLQLLADRLGFELLIPRPQFCTDNAAMIAAAGYERFRRSGPSPFDLPAFARRSFAGSNQQ
ncbi:MAG: tRNA (adenosine(37)-N6)-threonylcarbamoyltransferase complex transferase subunit TsaD [candidate division WOR-3 bacterium]|uniref:tRNA N6-adenosine threonylcarbamoyltransferase n=2 Tax=candidate division WOR-3 bacterium TaxID=2052148 RepID=A0A7C1SRK9_UNCW3|nr:tRNA (adenosine(37)-N6)-threonylcarbamoyltransferase complex transferase subunit TsaD [candidate division WOR-3 bacterium]